MQQILYGIGMIKAEEYIRKQLGDEFYEVGAVAHRLAILDTMRTTFTASSDAVVLIQEGLPSHEEIPLLDLIDKIRLEYPRVRIVLLAGNHEPGDDMLTALINMGVYDIVYGDRIDINAAIDLVRKPNTYADAAKFLRPVNYSVVAEKQQPTITTVVPEQSQMHSEPTVNKKATEQRVLPKKIKTPVVNPQVQEQMELHEIEQPPIVVKQNQVPAIKRKPNKKQSALHSGPTKVVSFCSCCSGIGNREIALSVACGLAMNGEKVVFIDCTSESPLLLSRLDFKNQSNGIYGAVREIESGKIVHNLYSPSIDVRNPDFKRLSKLPNSLFFLTYTLEDEDYNVSAQELERIVELLKADKLYDTILVCSSNTKPDDLEAIIGFSNIPYIVTTQSSYAFRLVEEISSHMDLSSTRLLFNKFEKGLQPNIQTSKDILGVSDVISIPCDNRGFLLADSCALPYPLVKTSGKVNKSIANIVQSLQKGVM